MGRRGDARIAHPARGGAPASVGPEPSIRPEPVEGPPPSYRRKPVSRGAGQWGLLTLSPPKDGDSPFALSLSKPVLRAHEGGLPATDIPALAGTHAPPPTPSPMLPPKPLLPYPSGTLPQPHT